MGILERIKRLFRDELLEGLAARYGLEAKPGSSVREGFAGAVPLVIEAYGDQIFINLGALDEDDDSYYLERVAADYAFEDDERLDRYVGPRGRDIAKQYALEGFMEGYEYLELKSAAFEHGLPKLSDAVVGVDVYPRAVVLCLTRARARLEDLEADIELGREMVKALGG